MGEREGKDENHRVGKTGKVLSRGGFILQILGRESPINIGKLVLCKNGVEQGETFPVRYPRVLQKKECGGIFPEKGTLG